MNNSRKNTGFTLVLILTITSACTNNVEEELFPPSGCTTVNMSYSNDINPIIETTCFPCHEAQRNDGNITLEGYENLKVHIDDGRVIGAITHSIGFSPMPQGKPKLSDCNLDRIKAWADNGAPNN